MVTCLVAILCFAIKLRHGHVNTFKWPIASSTEIRDTGAHCQTKIYRWIWKAFQLFLLPSRRYTREHWTIDASGWKVKLGRFYSQLVLFARSFFAFWSGVAFIHFYTHPIVCFLFFLFISFILSLIFLFICYSLFYTHPRVRLTARLSPCPMPVWAGHWWMVIDNTDANGQTNL